MAKTSIIEREKKRKMLVDKYAPKRKKYKAILQDPSTPEDVREATRRKLQALPRNGSRIRQRTRCALTGRPRGVYRKFGLARSMLRIHAMRGDIPGLVKSSW